MKKFLNSVIVAVLTVFFVAATAFAADLPNTGAVKGPQAHHLLDNRAELGLTIVDVRTPSEFKSGHAPGALNIPLDQLGNRIAELPEGPVLLLCRSGKRAQAAYEFLIMSGRSGEKLWFLAGSTDYSSGTPRFR